MTPKMIALDLDETLLNPAGGLSEKTRTAMTLAADKGAELVIATGRACRTIPQELRELPYIHYAITGNGAAIYRLADSKLLKRHPLRPETVKKVLQITKGEPVMYEAFVDGTPYAQADYIDNPEPYLAGVKRGGYIRETRHPVEDIRRFLAEQSGHLDSMDIVVQDEEMYRKIMNTMEALPELYVTTSTPRMIELSDPNCGKHRGLQFLAEYLNIPQEETAAFGNADNDAEMLAWAGIGIAVANATPKCLAAADAVTEHYAEDGVAKGLFRLFGAERKR